VKIRGSVVVVTGASSGIGWSTAWAFARKGAVVVATARREDRLAVLAGEIQARGGTAMGVGCDVTDLSRVEALRDRVAEVFGRCDVLVNNAGIPGGGNFADMSVKRLEEVVRTNLLGVIYATKAFLPMMLGTGRGHVVNVASIAGRVAIPGSAVYSGTKHAVVALSESLHYELSPRGVRVTAVNPGLVRTEGFPFDGRAVGVMTPERIARAIVRVVEKGTAPELSVPRSLAAVQAVRVLAPAPYRWGMARFAGRSGQRPAR
jgi:short-subunit dehydrogenase